VPTSDPRACHVLGGPRTAIHKINENHFYPARSPRNVTRRLSLLRVLLSRGVISSETTARPVYASRSATDSPAPCSVTRRPHWPAVRVSSADDFQNKRKSFLSGAVATQCHRTTLARPRSPLAGARYLAKPQPAVHSSLSVSGSPVRHASCPTNPASRGPRHVSGRF